MFSMFWHFFSVSLRNAVKKKIILLRTQFLLNLVFFLDFFLDLECGLVITVFLICNCFVSLVKTVFNFADSKLHVCFF